MKSETKKKIVIITCTLLYCAAMLIMYFLAIVPKKQPGEKTVGLELDYKNQTYIYNDIVTQSETLFELLQEFNDEFDLKFGYEDSGFGPFVTSFKDTAQDTEKGFYYMFKVNGVYSNFGISTTAIKDGDKIVFEYGIANYDENWATQSVTLQDVAGAQTGENRTYKKAMTAGSIVTIVCCTVVGAALLGGAVFTAVYRGKKKSSNNQ